MKKYLVAAVFSFILLASPSFTQAAGLTSSQINAILGLLSAFNADSATIANVKVSLTGGTPTLTPPVPSTAVTPPLPPAPPVPTPVFSSSEGLSVGRSSANLVSANVLAGASEIMAGGFTFNAQNTAYVLRNINVLVSSANSVSAVTLKYKDKNGITQSATSVPVVSPAISSMNGVATFTGLTMYVPANSSSNLDVYVSIPTIASGAVSGAAINVSLDTSADTFRAITSAGTTVTSLSVISADAKGISSGTTLYVRKSIPTFTMIPTGNTVPVTGSPLYKFSITADPAGAIEWSRLVFNIQTTGTAIVSNVFLVDDSSGAMLIDTPVNTAKNGVPMDLSQNMTQSKYQQIAAGTTKTYALYGTVAGYSADSSISINVLPDTSLVANVPASTFSGNTVWSDRSSSMHGLTSSDWTNGYLLKNFANNTVTYSKTGTASTFGTLVPSDTFVNFNVVQGAANPASYNLHLTNSSTIPVTLTLSMPNQPAWLNTGYNTQPMTLISGGVMGVGVSVDATKVTPGTYTTNLIVSGNFSNSPITLPVTLKVTAPTVAVTSGLTSSQINSILSLLTSFGANSTVVGNAKTVLSGGTLAVTPAPSNLTSSQINSIFSLLTSWGTSSTVMTNMKIVLGTGTGVSAVTTTLDGSPISVAAGQSSKITWTSTNAKYCTLTTGSIDDYGAGAAPLNGSKIVGPLTANRTITLTCNGASGSTSKVLGLDILAPVAALGTYQGYLAGSMIPFITTNSISKQDALNNCMLNHNNNPTTKIRCTWNGVEIYSFAPTPITPAPTTSLSTSATSVPSGQSATITWTSTNAFYCTLTTGSIDDYGPAAAPLSGSKTVGPLTAARTATLTCNGAGGSVTKSVSIGVTASAPAPTALIQVTNSGNKSILSWSSTNASECSLYDNAGYIMNTGNVVSSRTGFTGTYASGSLTASASNTYNYGCSNSTGITGWKSVSTYLYTPGTGVQVGSSQLPKCSCDVSQARDCSTTGFVSGDQGPVCYEIYNAQTDPFGGPAYMSVPYTRGSGSVATARVSGANQMASALGAFNSATSVAAPEPQSSFSYVWNNNLQIGSFGAEVIALQAVLTKEGVYAGEITGGFYNQTFIAVKAFQQKYGIEATGFVGPGTRAKLNSLYAK